MLKILRRPLRQRLVPSLALILAASTFVGPSAHAQAPKAERQKEPTDGFFDVPARDPSEESEPWGLPAYLVTAAFASLAMMIVCKTARRG